MPKLDHVLYNFVGCTAMMFGSKSRYCITYKQGEIGFNIYRRKYKHTFLANLDKSSFERSEAASMNTIS